MKRLMCVFILMVAALPCFAFAEVTTFQHGYGCAGDSQDDATLHAESETLAVIKFIGYEISPTRQEIAVSRTLQIAKADNSISTEAAPYDEWGKAQA